MNFESDLWESFLEVTKEVFMVSGTVLVISQMLRDGIDLKKLLD